MQFITAGLNQTMQGNCDGCGEKRTELTAAITKVYEDFNRRDALGKPLTTGETSFLVCGQCAGSHPLWKTPAP